MIIYEKLLSDSTVAKINPDDNYHYAYQRFLSFFAEKQDLTVNDIFIGANFTYAWMPTMNKTASQISKALVDGINHVRNGGAEFLTNAQVVELSKATNNSLVGASKLLHFIFPDKYAIWDSRVARYILSNSNKQLSSYYYYLNNYKNFVVYMDVMKNLAKEDEKNNHRIKDLISEAVRYEVTTNRAIELVMFVLGRKT